MASFETLKYHVQNNKIGDLISWISEGKIGLPEMQRPFVWQSYKVRDLIDSLYRGYPIGYIITWNNPDIRLKDGGIAHGKTLMIDGQQRVTALTAAIAGEKVMDRRFVKKRIRIAFNPQKEIFATRTPAIAKDPTWIDDIAQLFTDGYSDFTFITKFAAKNGLDPDSVAPAIQHLRNLTSNEIGNIQLSEHLDMDAVTEIFNRINSKGTVLSSADFIMSKLSSDDFHHGDMLRKVVEYFSRLMRDPAAIADIRDNDSKFSNSEYYKWIAWAADEHTDLYQPEFGDIFHVILNFKFARGKHADLISLVSGRDFATKQYTQEAMDHTYDLLADGIQQVTDKSNFQRFMMILRGMGMISHSKVKFQGTGALNFSYALYLLLKNEYSKDFSHSQIENIVRRWLLMSILTQRYSGAAESQSEIDIKQFRSEDPLSVLARQEKIQLYDGFWSTTLPQKLNTSSSASNLWRAFLMAQAKSNSPLWLEDNLKVVDAVTEEGNIHHIFPRAYLRKHGFRQDQYNQIANFVFLSQPRNLQISDQAPVSYLHTQEVTQFATAENFEANAIPESLKDMDYTSYDDFLRERRQLMAERIKELYYSFDVNG
ncbi:GmrSD restriction endonuclease domain-containing protein [Lacticaseibacillus hegangensis]|uniref:DUF262 domain-containing protein n=1 Tax=Lacticaseibacillus hegangensis TaxID=2486010 RepID=A0ABW4D0F9_9LACO|nr:DUF262 domain-containing protein [Lacticaseibacillus hegangensis]